MGLSAAERESFLENGLQVVPGLFSPEEVGGVPGRI
jgi:hypothetical protein